MKRENIEQMTLGIKTTAESVMQRLNAINAEDMSPAAGELFLKTMVYDLDIIARYAALIEKEVKP